MLRPRSSKYTYADYLLKQELSLEELKNDKRLLLEPLWNGLATVNHDCDVNMIGLIPSLGIFNAFIKHAQRSLKSTTVEGVSRARHKQTLK